MESAIAKLQARAGDIMQRSVITVHVDDSLREIERVLIDSQIGAVPVLDDCGAVLGVITIRDVIRSYAATDRSDDDRESEDDDSVSCWNREDEEPRAIDLMSADFVTVAPTTSVTEMAQVMLESQTHRALVVDDQRLIGIASTMDVLRAVAAGAPRQPRGRRKFSRSLTPKALSTSVRPLLDRA